MDSEQSNPALRKLVEEREAELEDEGETLVSQARRRFLQKRLNHPRRNRNRSKPRPGVRNSGEDTSPRGVRSTAKDSDQAQLCEVRINSSTPANTHTEHSTFEIS
ncbi:hypothetical protein FHL15_000624 [Xylaria flabelliformis]|uniref:Uncharacterized protein n=1 Tax=Xylaria flabelliformis TaxID=2512241 RepID=A0A553IED6_9PEZI|nr:hypothetical protein FHL15_000624 [Xylaria flabelliformis]